MFETKEMSEIPVLPIYKCSNPVKLAISEVLDILLPYILKSLKLDKLLNGAKFIILFLLKFSLNKPEKFSRPEISDIFFDCCKYEFDKSRSVILFISLIVTE